VNAVVDITIESVTYIPPPHQQPPEKNHILYSNMINPVIGVNVLATMLCNYWKARGPATWSDGMRSWCRIAPGLKCELS